MAKKSKGNELGCCSKTILEIIGRDQLNEKIKEIAHGLYEKKGHVRGHELDDWLEAEKIVKKK